MTGTIISLDPTTWGDEIDRIFKSAYRLEADLLGVDLFPPLERNIEDLAVCGNAFFGCLRNDELCGVMEIETPERGNTRVIASLAVAPSHFRLGIGKALVQHALSSFRTPILVSTGADNEPAIRLYQALGFRFTTRFTTPDGIAMVELATGRSGG
ncbi:MAG: GNAT family N-acetyltransferase [Pseudomonadales bacterium]